MHLCTKAKSSSQTIHIIDKIKCLQQRSMTLMTYLKHRLSGRKPKQLVLVIIKKAKSLQGAVKI